MRRGSRSNDLGASGGGQPPPLREPARRVWIVIHHRADDGARVRAGIRDTGWTVFWPRMIIRAPKRDDVLKPWFPGYMFATRPPGGPTYGAIMRLPNVVTVLGVRECGSPSPAPAAMVEALIARAGGIDPGLIDMTPDRTIPPGAPVRITTGPLAGFHGLYHSDAGQDRVRVLLTLMGRDVLHTAPRDAVAGT